MRASSTNQGLKGSTIRPTDEGDRSGDPPARELRVLLIEDSALLRTRLIKILTEPGIIRVEATAETEKEAMAYIDASQFDVLVVDVELRQGSGIAVIRHARRVYAGLPQPLIIVLTNYALPAVRDRCLTAGADYFLDKMHQFNEVRPLIERNGSNGRH